MKITFNLILCLFLALGPISLQRHAHADDVEATDTVKCDCPPSCHCKQPDGTCPKDGPCVEGCECDADEPPTFTTDPSQVGRHETGLVKPKPLTMDQWQAQQDFPEMARREGWTFDYDVRQIGARAKGLVKPLHKLAGAGNVDDRFEKMDIKIPARFHIKDFGRPLMGHFDQGACGSCVYNSAVKGWTDNLSIHGLEVEPLSRSQVMNCTGGGQCNGEWMISVAGYIQKLNGLFTEAVYPYKAQTRSCDKTKTGPKFGDVKSFTEISHSQRSMFAAILSGFPVHVTVGANNPWSGFKGGIYNACSSAQTNHEILFYGYDCESSTETIDGVEYCKFDSKGNLPPGVGFGIFPNSWGDGFGVGGDMISRFTDKSGRLCNNIAEEAVIMDSGLPMPTKEPVSVAVKIGHVSLKVTFQPKATSQQKPVMEQIRQAIEAVEAETKGML